MRRGRQEPERSHAQGRASAGEKYAQGRASRAKEKSSAKAEAEIWIRRVCREDRTQETKREEGEKIWSRRRVERS